MSDLAGFFPKERESSASGVGPERPLRVEGPPRGPSREKYVSCVLVSDLLRTLEFGHVFYLGPRPLRSGSTRVLKNPRSRQTSPVPLRGQDRVEVA